MADSNYWTKRKISRRGALRGAGVAVAGLAGAALVGCGSDDEPAPAATAAATTAGTATAATATAVAAAADQPVRGGVLTLNGTNFSKLEAVTGTGGGDHQYLWAVFDNLVGYAADFSADPKRSLAQTWENPDPLKWVFNLRPGVKFHDGTVLNAESIVANFNYATNPDVASNVRTDLGSIDRAEAVDELTAVYHMKKPQPGLLATLGDRAGFISSPTAIEKFGADYGLNPVGTGAFMHEEFVKDSHTKVRRNPEYWGRDDAGESLPYLDGIHWRNVDTPAAAVAALKTKELQLLWGVAGQFHRELQADPNINFLSAPGAGGSNVFLNYTRPPFDNAHLRRAFAASFDRQVIIDSLYFGAATPSNGMIGPAHWAHPAEVPPQTLDPALVKASLDLAGMPDGFSFQMSVSSSPIGVQEGELIQASAKQFGIDVQLQALGTPDYYLRYIEDGFADSMNAGLSARADPVVYFRFNHHSEGTYRKTVTNVLDEEINALGEIADRNELKSGVAALAKKINDEAYSAYTRHAFTVVAAQPNVHVPLFADGKPHLGFGDAWLTA